MLSQDLLLFEDNLPSGKSMQSIQGGDNATPNNYKLSKMTRTLQIGGHTQLGDKPGLNDMQDRICARNKNKLEIEKTM